MTVLKIDGTDYQPQQRILEARGILRQTLWRWRKAGLIPAGYLHPRTNQLVFTVPDVEGIRDYGNRLEPTARSPHREQVSLFSTSRSRGSQ